MGVPGGPSGPWGPSGPGGPGGPTGVDVPEDHARPPLQPQPGRHRAGDGLRVDADLPASHTSSAPDLIVDVAHDVARGSEADAFVPAGLGDDGGVDPDHATTGVDQRATAVARVDGGVGLDDLADEHVVGALNNPTQGAHNAHGQGALEAEGVADGDDELAHPQALRRAQGNRMEQPLGDLDFEPGNLERMQERLDFLLGLERRYQMPVDKLAEQGKIWSGELESLVFADEERGKLTKKRSGSWSLS